MLNSINLCMRRMIEKDSLKDAFSAGLFLNKVGYSLFPVNFVGDSLTLTKN